MIGRVCSAHPSEGDRFYLRIHLHHVTGCRSYKDIRTFPDDTICNTYKEAARRRGLLEDDQECDDCLTYDASYSMPSELRQLYELEFDVHHQAFIAETNIPVLNSDQYEIYNCIIETITDTGVEQRAFFIDGSGGNGKTFLYNTLLAKIEGPIPLNDLSVCNIPKQSALAKLIQSAKLIVWDEAPMVHRYAAECINRSSRDICSCELPFGGDFHQILPVIRHSTRAQSLDQHDSVEVSNFSDFLLRVGEGTEPENESNMIYLDAKI
ncbi:ATP-dependent DNA helicase PIF1-like [Oopsacas minuta]|uniref:ATP-dependent DNA helicase n=1 Tax=Oopsacas minuta TaxID=111878 RepID=A0AAV7JWJ5_9METZ|nr:ATP-dependent DNA helicase PIF1-like [Oopsacas minuta]